MRTRFTELLGCALPIQVAGMGGCSSASLVDAVVGAGGAAAVAPHGAPRAAVEALLDGLAPGAAGCNVLVPFLDVACVEAAAARVAYVEFFYGDPDARLVELVHQGGALAMWQVGSADEAAAAEQAGCDAVIAQGVEAGGHVRGSTPLLQLLDRVLDGVEVPVVAAGGIATARHLAAVLAAGAGAARIGTPFVATVEADAHPDYQAALLAADVDDTVLTEAFGVGWPHAPHRVLRSSVAAASALHGDAVGEVDLGGRLVPLPRFGPQVAQRSVTGHVEAMALYAGCGVGSVTEVRPAAELLRSLADGAAALLGRACEGLLS